LQRFSTLQAVWIKQTVPRHCEELL
jgi:hypothetical protein